MGLDITGDDDVGLELEEAPIRAVAAKLQSHVWAVDLRDPPPPTLPPPPRCRTLPAGGTP